jgi:hypothetical protein
VNSCNASDNPIDNFYLNNMTRLSWIDNKVNGAYWTENQTKAFKVLKDQINNLKTQNDIKTTNQISKNEDNPFGKDGFGSASTSGFGTDFAYGEGNEGSEGSEGSDGTTCSCIPTNLNTIINLLKNNVIVTRPTSATVKVGIKADGSISSISISGLGGSDISVERKIKEIILRTTFTSCNGKNRNSRSYTFPKIVLKHD